MTPEQETAHRLEQRRSALIAGNAIRTRRAELKRDITAGRVQTIDVIAEPPEYALTMPVIDLLLATRGVGKIRARDIMARCAVFDLATLGSLSDGQRVRMRAKIGIRLPLDQPALRPAGGAWEPAMQIANQRKIARTAIHRRVMAAPLRSRAAIVADLFEDPDPSLFTMPAAELLTWAAYVGPSMARKFLYAARVARGRRVGQLTPRQQHELARCLRGQLQQVLDDALELDRRAREVAA